jgi:hypothetical protein
MQTSLPFLSNPFYLHRTVAGHSPGDDVMPLCRCNLQRQLLRRTLSQDALWSPVPVLNLVLLVRGHSSL